MIVKTQLSIGYKLYYLLLLEILFTQGISKFQLHSRSVCDKGYLFAEFYHIELFLDLYSSRLTSISTFMGFWCGEKPKILAYPNQLSYMLSLYSSVYDWFSTYEYRIFEFYVMLCNIYVETIPIIVEICHPHYCLGMGDCS